MMVLKNVADYFDGVKRSGAEWLGRNSSARICTIDDFNGDARGDVLRGVNEAGQAVALVSVTQGKGRKNATLHGVAVPMHFLEDYREHTAAMGEEVPLFRTDLETFSDDPAEWFGKVGLSGFLVLTDDNDAPQLLIMGTGASVFLRAENGVPVLWQNSDADPGIDIYQLSL